MEKQQFTISIRINADGFNRNFIFGKEKKTEFVTEDKEEATKEYYRQRSILAQLTTISPIGEVILTLDKISSNFCVTSGEVVKQERFCFSGQLICVLREYGVFE